MRARPSRQAHGGSSSERRQLDLSPVGMRGRLSRSPCARARRRRTARARSAGRRSRAARRAGSARRARRAARTARRTIAEQPLVQRGLELRPRLAIVTAAPWIDASGVRSSCETVATKSVRICSRRAPRSGRGRRRRPRRRSASPRSRATTRRTARSRRRRGHRPGCARAARPSPGSPRRQAGPEVGGVKPRDRLGGRVPQPHDPCPSTSKTPSPRWRSTRSAWSR